MEISKEPTLTIAISTIHSNLKRFVSSFSFKSLIAADEVLVIIQGAENEVTNKVLKNYNVIYDKDFGISRSRNLGIENANSDYIWFLDDDVSLFDDSIYKIKNHLRKNPSIDLHTIRMECLDNTPYKKYPNKNYLSRINSLGVSSVELIVSKKFVINNDIRFNNNLGLGSEFPSTEENIFFLDIFDKGGLVYHYPKFLLRHEYIDRKTIHFKNEFILKAKGAFCRKYGGLTGFLILGYYSLKCILLSKNFLIVLNLFFGFFNAQSIFGVNDE